MFTSIKKIVAGLGLVALCVAPAIAGQLFINTSYGPQSGTAVVPNVGSCGQVCYSASPYSWETNTGPLGTYTLSGYNGNKGSQNEYLIVQGPVAPGSYYCSVYQSGGYASVTVNW